MSRKLTVLILGLLAAAAIRAQTPDGSWAYYGQNAGGMRYSGLKQISRDNVKQLAVAWTYRTGELKKYEGTSVMEQAAFETTPILIGRTLYFSTPSDRVFAVDAATGQERWVYDPQVNLKAGYSEITSRGVTAWPAGAKAAQKIFIGTIDGRLIALDATTGKPDLTFGNEGVVSLQKGAGGNGNIAETSPPTVVGDLVIVGSSLGDNQRFDYPPGIVRAYNVKTGDLAWSWNPIPQDPADSAYATWNGPNAHRA
ncbi:MAG TPA: PQQ-binding-like beta-propeller repeat protein, partial [Puia sp.]|nr:PQQ-binding-like beta-propeller repeat protein [Puia sp.]